MISRGEDRWRPARSADWAAVRSLLASAEASWLTLIDRLCSAAPYWQRHVWLLDGLPGRPALEACFYLNDAGLALFAARQDSAAWDLNGLLKRCQRRLDRLYCLIGLSAQLDRLQPCLGRPAVARNDYLVMVRPPPRPGPVELSRPAQWPRGASSGFLWRGLEIRRAGDADTDALLDLQCAYEVEEVLVANHQLNRLFTRRALGMSLREQCVFCADAGNQMVAKAGTNGFSWRFAQIGGVFTDPRWRRHGIAEHLMEAVLADILAHGYGASLFVKRQNVAAQGLYGKLGFEAADSLSIAYY